MMNRIKFSHKYFCVIAELQCTSFEHVKVNSAFVLTMCYAFPDKKILLLAEHVHLQQIASELAIHKLINIEFCEIAIPQRNLSQLQRLFPDFIVTYELLSALNECKISHLVLLSINTTLLLAIKFLLWFKYSTVKVLAIPHSILGSITSRLSRRPWYWLLRFKTIFAYGNFNRVRYLILGPSILKNLQSEISNIGRYCYVLNHPYLFSGYENQKTYINKLIFGYLGVAHVNKGFDKFILIANAIHKTYEAQDNDNYEFICIGGLDDKSINKNTITNVNMPFMGRPIPNDEYQKLCGQITYAILPYKKDAYGLYPSGAVFDAFAHIKPIICIKNSYFEHLFEYLGDIGFLCDTYEEIINTIEGIINDFPHDRYQKQCDNIKKGRQFFEPKTLNNNLRDIIFDFTRDDKHPEGENV